MPPRLSNTLVIDNGGYSIKAGYASRSSSASDCVTVPNCIARTRDKRILIGRQIENYKDYGSMSFRRPVEKGYLVNWEAEKEIWDRLFMDDSSILKLSKQTATRWYLKNTTLALITDASLPSSLVPWNDITRLFDTDGQVQRAPSEAVLVIDAGYSFTHVIPVINGKPWHSAVSRIDVGGKVMTNYLKEMLSIRQLNMMDETYIINEIKEACCFVSTDFVRDLETCKNLKSNSIVMDYVLPDYKTIHKGFARAHESKQSTSNPDQRLVLGNERFAIPELLFSPGDVGYKQAGLPDVVTDSIKKVPERFRAVLWANIVLVGGNALIPGFKERLEAELRSLAPQDCIIRIGRPEQPLSYIWQGGVALANNKSVFDQKRITRADYLENGSAWLSRKFGGHSLNNVTPNPTIGSGLKRRTGS